MQAGLVQICLDIKQWDRARQEARQPARHCLAQQRKGQGSGSAALAGEQQGQAVQRPRGLGSWLRQVAGGEVGERAGAAGAAFLGNGGLLLWGAVVGWHIGCGRLSGSGLGGSSMQKGLAAGPATTVGTEQRAICAAASALLVVKHYSLCPTTAAQHQARTLSTVMMLVLPASTSGPKTTCWVGGGALHDASGNGGRRRLLFDPRQRLPLPAPAARLHAPQHLHLR